jgi:hypothetical protein
LSTHDADDLLGHLVDRTISVDNPQKSSVAVEGEQRLRGSEVGFKPLPNRVGRVVGTLDDRPAADIADAIDRRRIEDGVVDVTSVGADATTGEAFHQPLSWNVEQHNCVNPPPPPRKRVVERLGLSQRSRKPVVERSTDGGVAA